MDWNNKEQVREYNRNYTRARRQRIIKYLGGKCVVCSSVESLEVDHIDPTQKKLSIRTCINSNFERVKEEVDKCQLLCKDHHIEKTNSEKNSFTHGTLYAWQKRGCRCDVCRPEWRAWHDARNARRRKKSS